MLLALSPGELHGIGMFESSFMSPCEIEEQQERSEKEQQQHKVAIAN
jgi:hypothetical protein